ncbi:MAG: PAS domain S-box protein [Pseudomonadota bacterium]
MPRDLKSKNEGPGRAGLEPRDANRKKSEEQFRRMWEIMPFPVAVISASGEYEYLNPKFTEVFGYVKEDIPTGAAWFAKVFPDQAYRREVLSAWKNDLAGSQYFQVRPRTFTVVCNNGEHRDILFRPATMEDGRELVVYEDITERKKLEEELLYQSLALNQIQDCVTITDLSGRITYVNEAECRLLKRARRDIIGQTVHIYGENPEKGTAQDEIIATTLSRERWRGEVVNLDSENKEIILDCRTQVVRDKSGTPFSLCGIATDVTERKKTEASLTRLLEVSQALADAKGLTDTLRYCLASAISASGMDLGGIYLVNEGLTEINLVVHQGLNPEKAGPASTAEKNFFIRETLRQGKPRYLGSADIPPDALDKQAEGLKSLAIIPIIHQGKTIACLNLGSRLKEEIDPGVQPLIEALAAQSGGFIARSLAEEALRESEMKFRGFVENSSDIIYSLTEDGVFAYVSPNWKNILGHDLQNVVGRSFFSFVHEDDVEACRDYFQEAKNNRRLGFGVEYRIAGPDGEWKWNSSTASTAQKPNGNIVYIGIARDITARKKAEEALRKSENLLRKIFDILPVGLWFADRDGRLLKGNAMGVKIWGAEPLVSQDEYRVFKAWRLPSGQELAPEDWALAKTINQGVSILDEMLEIEAFDGQRKIILNSTAPVLDENNRVEGAVIVNLDVTERQRAEEEKEKLRAELVQAQKMESVGRLAGGVAHDFNNMLQAILGHADLALLDIKPRDPLAFNLQQIKKSAKRSAELVQQLLAFARKQTILPKVLNLNDTIPETLKMLQRLVREDIRLLWRPGDNPWNIRMDPAQLDQILANLVANSRDAIPGAGVITIETATASLADPDLKGPRGLKPGDYVVLTIKDTGLGIRPEFMEKIFDPFFTTKEVGQGPGLGLATVYGIVKQNEGVILVESELGRGSTFNIYFPRFKEEADQPAAASPRADLPRGNETVLLVEDEEQILSLGRKVLELQGYRVLTALTPSEALEIERQFKGEIHLLLTDVIMPEMDGRQLQGILLQSRPQLKSLFMSGYSEEIVARRGVLEAGIRFLPKPFSVEALVKKTREALDL